MTQPSRMLQIHVTNKCNLQCLHCYSHSGPDQAQSLDLAALECGVRDAKALGYNVISLSGGEPFLYSGMTALIKAAKAEGLSTAVVTNGMFLDARRLAPLEKTLDLIVISLDGAPERHNVMRANAAAFETMDAKLPALRASGIPFGFLFTLTDDNAEDIDWAADFALANGARLLQIHPLDLVGRAQDNEALDGKAPSQSTAITAAKAAHAAKLRLRGALDIVVDYQPRVPEDLLPVPGSCGAPSQFADLVHPLCIETDGSVVPIGHGFGDMFKIGNIAKERLVDMAQTWTSAQAADDYQNLLVDTLRATNSEQAPLLKNIAQVTRHASLNVQNA